MSEQESKSWKEKAADLPGIGWIIGIFFRALGIKVDKKND